MEIAVSLQSQGPCLLYGWAKFIKIYVVTHMLDTAYCSMNWTVPLNVLPERPFRTRKITRGKFSALEIYDLFSVHRLDNPASF